MVLARSQAVLSLLVFLMGCGDAPEDTAVDCATRPFGVAPPRAELEGVWDAPRNRMVFFGGDQGVPINCATQTDFTGETWSWQADCDNFALLTPDEGPSSRGRHAVALDPDRHQMIIHGGRFREGTEGNYTLRADTWALDLETDTWSEWETSGEGPSKRSMHAAAVAGDTFYVFGGSTSKSGASYAPQSDLWALDLESRNWEKLGEDDGPSAREFHGMTASADGTTLYVYGGGDENAFVGPFLGDLWRYDIAEATWERLHRGANNAPEARIWADLLSDDARGRLLLWAGHDDGQLGNTSELWGFDLSSEDWTQLQAGDVLNSSPLGFCDFPADFTTPDLEAPERRYAGIAVMADNDVLISGGKTDCGIINDVWSYDLETDTWTERSPATSGEICTRAFSECESLCF